MHEGGLRAAFFYCGLDFGMDDNGYMHDRYMHDRGKTGVHLVGFDGDDTLWRSIDGCRVARTQSQTFGSAPSSG